jgi:heat shock protein HtpX
VANPRPLDLAALVVSVAPLRLALFVSCLVGLAIGVIITIVCAFVTTLLLPLGFFPMLAAIIATSVNAAQLSMIAVAAAVVIPIGAAFAAHLKLRNVETFLLEDCGATQADPNSKIGQWLLALSQRAGLPEVPRYGILEDEFNACAISSGHSVGLVLVGGPLASTLKPAETIAVIGHEIGHIAMRDGERKYLMIAHQEYLTSFLLWAGLKRWARALFGFIAELALAAHSREREYWADAVGAHVTSPAAMISALRSLSQGPRRPTKFEKRYDALMFRPVGSFFSTHPSFEKRIEALESRRYLDRLPLIPLAVSEPEQPLAPAPRRFSGI